MAKEKTNYVCSECGGTSAKWLGKCPNCGAWNTLIEQVAGGAGSGGGSANNRFSAPFAALAGTADLAVLSEIEATDIDRTSTGIEELDREWDVERMLGVNGASVALAGLVLGATVNKKWLIVPGIVLPLLLNFNLRGWAPAVPVLRRLGMRTRSEIGRERDALLASRADAAGA